MVVHRPADGVTGGAIALLAFACFWLAFIAFWTAGALGVFFGGGGQIGWENGLFAAFSTPFWLVGIGMLIGVVWTVRGTRSVYMDSDQMVTELRCLFWRRMRTYERNQVQCAREGLNITRQGKKGSPTTNYVVEVVRDGGAFTLPCTGLAERAWVAAEINDFLKSVPYDPARRELFSNSPEWEDLSNTSIN
jgi:hypothetical protein